MTDKTEKKLTPMEQRLANLKPFRKGESGNLGGRPAGSRNKLSEDFLKAMADDFEANGVDVIQTVRESNPVAYLKAITLILPKEIKADVNHKHKHTHEAVSETAAWINGLIDRAEDGETKKPRPN